MNLFASDKPFVLESGRKLPGIKVAYHTYGRLNKERDNVIWICHALTGSSAVHEWWPGLVGPGLTFDTSRFFVICANMTGSCYGSTGPLDPNPYTGNPWFHFFPELTIRDQVKAFRVLRKELGIRKIHALAGGSMGGQQALEWAIEEPELISNLILLATNAIHSSWGIAFNESQRLAIKADRSWYSPSPDAGLKGLRAARSIALLSYRSYQSYQQTRPSGMKGPAPAVSYQRYQGDKLIRRFNAFSYWFLSMAMDSHDCGRGRGGVEKALSGITAATSVIGISSDGLFPVEEQEFLATHIPDAGLEIIDSHYGHDGFLTEREKLSEIISPALAGQFQTI